MTGVATTGAKDTTTTKLTSLPTEVYISTTAGTAVNGTKFTGCVSAIDKLSPGGLSCPPALREVCPVLDSADPHAPEGDLAAQSHSNLCCAAIAITLPTDVHTASLLLGR